MKYIIRKQKYCLVLGLVMRKTTMLHLQKCWMAQLWTFWIFKQILKALVEFLSLVINKDPMLEAIMQVAATESIIQEEDGLLCRRNQQETGWWFHYWDSALLSNWKVCFLCFYVSCPSLVSQSTLSFSNS